MRSSSLVGCLQQLAARQEERHTHNTLTRTTFWAWPITKSLPVHDLAFPTSFTLPGPQSFMRGRRLWNEGLALLDGKLDPKVNHRRQGGDLAFLSLSLLYKKRCYRAFGYRAMYTLRTKLVLHQLDQHPSLLPVSLEAALPLPRTTPMAGFMADGTTYVHSFCYVWWIVDWVFPWWNKQPI